MTAALPPFDPLVFSEASSGDVDDVVGLVQAAYRGPTSRQGWTTEADLLEGQRVEAAMVHELLDRPDALVLTARRSDSLVACCELQHRADDDAAYLGMFAVKPGLQGAGTGRAVLAEAERLVRRRWGVSRMLLSVIDLRLELIAWYERRGYTPTGESGDFPYGDERFGRPTREDLRFIVMAKPLTAHSSDQPPGTGRPG